MLRWQVFVAAQRLWSLRGWKLRSRDDPKPSDRWPLMFEKHLAFVLNLFILGFIWVINKWFGYNVVSIYLLSSPIRCSSIDKHFLWDGLKRKAEGRRALSRWHSHMLLRHVLLIQWPMDEGFMLHLESRQPCIETGTVIGALRITSHDCIISPSHKSMST